jgi:hypothetical protein
MRFVISGRAFDLDPDAIATRAGGVLPDPIGDHFVVIGGRRFPPKQVLALATRLDRADFNTHQARRVLRRLGFSVGRKSSEKPRPSPGGSGPHRGAEADALRPFAGKWVAQKGIDVLVAAETPQDVLSWLERHDVQADAMFRVPPSRRDAEGSASF